MGQISIQHPVFWVLIIIWTLIWKGIALWKASKNNHKWWFIVLLVINTVGILEILYIYVFGKKTPLNSVKSGEAK